MTPPRYPAHRASGAPIRGQPWRRPGARASSDIDRRAIDQQRTGAAPVRWTPVRPEIDLPHLAARPGSIVMDDFSGGPPLPPGALEDGTPPLFGARFAPDARGRPS